MPLERLTQRRDFRIARRLCRRSRTVDTSAAADPSHQLMDLVADLALYGDESRDVHQHRVVPSDVPAGKPDGARNHEDAYRCLQSPWQFRNPVVLWVLQWQHVGVVVDVAHDAFRVVRKHLGRAKVVVRWVQADDEVSRKEIVAEHLVVAVRIDEDVRERRGRVADVATPIEEPEKLPDLAVDPGNLVLPMPDVDRGVVRLVVDQQHRLADRRGPALRVVSGQPLDEVAQRARVLLDHEHRRLDEVLEGYANAVRDRLAEVPLGCGERGRPPPEIEASDTDDGLIRKRLSQQVAGTVESDEALVDSSLGLVAQVVVDAGNDDDHLVAGIRRLADQPRVVGRLAGLDMADHHAAAIPLSRSGRILEESEYPVRHVIQRGKHVSGEVLAHQ